MIGIYAIFRKSDDKCMYVGQSKNINKRLKDHICHKNSRFNERDYYGKVIEPFDFYDKENQLNREAYWIKELNPELNIIRDETDRGKYLSGENNPMYGKNSEDYMTPDAIITKRSKQSAALKGKHFSEEHKNNLSIYHADFSGENHPMYGKHHTIESNEKNRQAHLGTKWINNNEITKCVKEYELDKYIRAGWKFGRLKKC